MIALLLRMGRADTISGMKTLQRRLYTEDARHWCYQRVCVELFQMKRYLSLFWWSLVAACVLCIMKQTPQGSEVN